MHARTVPNIPGAASPDALYLRILGISPVLAVFSKTVFVDLDEFHPELS